LRPFFIILLLGATRLLAAQNLVLEKHFAAMISADSARQYVRDLVALGPRLGGTSSNEKSAQYLQQKFSSWRLKTQIIIDPEQLTHEELQWQLEQIAPERHGFARPWPYGFSPTSPTKEAEVVLPTQLSDGAALAGKAVLMETFITPRQYDEIVTASASAILSDAPARNGDFSEWAMIGRLPARANNAIPAYAISRSDGLRLRKLIAAGKKPVVKFSLQSRISKGRPQTVIAAIPARHDEAKRNTNYLIYCAHGDSDSGGPGADDNASGVATVMETARALQKLIANGVLPPPRYTIRFMIWGSELSSSTAYLDAHRDSLAQIAGVINFDETGTGSLYQAVYFEGNEVPWNEKLLRTVDAIGRQYCGQKGFWPSYTTNPTQGGTDAYAFLPPGFHGMLNHKARIPAITIFTAAWDTPNLLRQTPGWSSPCWPRAGPNDGKMIQIDYSRYYHSSGDIPEWTTDKEPWRVAWCAKAGGLALLRLAW
jgi:hypothetical protein